MVIFSDCEDTGIPYAPLSSISLDQKIEEREIIYVSLFVSRSPLISYGSYVGENLSIRQYFSFKKFHII